jgi:hypothetical protein
MVPKFSLEAQPFKTLQIEAIRWARICISGQSYILRNVHIVAPDLHFLHEIRFYKNIHHILQGGIIMLKTVTTSRFLTLLTFCFGAVSTINPSMSFALSPPWFIFQSKMKATVGADQCVSVDDLKEDEQDPGSFDLVVHSTCGYRKTQALSTLISRTHTFGNISVKVIVLNSENHLVEPKEFPTDPEIAEALVKRALRGNPYFVCTAPGNAIFKFFIVFEPRVIQFFADNLSDAYRNMNLVAADAFYDALGLDMIRNIRMGTSTEMFRHRPVALH